MASSKGRRYRLTNNFNDVIYLYIENWTNTVEIGKKYGVSATSVSELLLRRGYSKENRDLLWFNRIKNLNKIFYNYKNISEQLNIPIRKIKRLCYKFNYQLLTEYDSIVKKYGNNIKKDLLTLSSKKILKKYKVKLSIIYRIKKSFNIQKNTLIEQFFYKISKNQFYEELKIGTLTSLSKKYNISKNLVRTLSKEVNYEREQVSQTTLSKLSDKKWCIKTYNQYKSYKIISKILGDVSADTVARYCNIHGIKKYHIFTEIDILINKAKLKNSYKQESIASLAIKLNCSPWYVSQQLNYFNIPITKQHHISIGEKEIYNYIKLLLKNSNIIENDRTLISPKEIDILVPDKKIAIEYCGIYYHSNKFKKSNYHLNKMNLLNEKGYRLITIFENEWVYNNLLIKNKLKYIFNLSTEKVYGRNTDIDYATYSECNEFMNNYHIQGGNIKSTIRLCLKFNNEIIAIMTFLKYKNYYILNRYASKISVVGGFSKLIKYFQKVFKSDIKTFADLRWSDINNNIYINNEFNLIHITPPAYQYIEKNKLVRREHYMRKYLPDKLENFDYNLTEEKNTKNNNIFRIYDCGKAVYYLTYNSE